MTFSDFGICLEMVGFFLYLISAKQMPTYELMGYENKTEIVNPIWAKFYLEMKGDKSQFTRVLAIILILVGLLLQLQYFV